MNQPEKKSDFTVIVDVPGEGSRTLPAQTKDAFEQQAGFLKAIFNREPKNVDFDDVKNDWKEKLAQVNALAEVADSGTSDKSGLKLTEIQLGLTVTAEGHLAFIASASASATFTVTFSRS